MAINKSSINETLGMHRFFNEQSFALAQIFTGDTAAAKEIDTVKEKIVCMKCATAEG